MDRSVTAAYRYFAQCIPGYREHELGPQRLVELAIAAQSLLVVQVFTAAGWHWCDRPYQQLTPHLVSTLHDLGVQAVHIAGYHGQHADFTLNRTGPIGPAYLT